MKYRYILWDVDDTLLNFKKSEEYAFKDSLEKFGIPYREELLTRYSKINKSFWKKLELGEIEKEEVLLGRFRQFFQTMKDEGNNQAASIDITAFQANYQTKLGSVYFYRDDSLRLCQSLKEQGISQYIVTNGVKWTQENKLHLSGFDKVVDAIFISEEIGYVKPERLFFDRCFERIDSFEKKKGNMFERSQTLIVGDSLSSDMLGGSNADIATCWYNPERIQNVEQGIRIDYEIHHLSEIQEIIL